VRLIIFTLSMASLVLSSACGGGGGGEGGGGGGGGGGCTLTITGDAASGIGSNSVPCGYITTTAPITFGRPVEVTAMSNGVPMGAAVFLFGDFRAPAVDKIAVWQANSIAPSSMAPMLTLPVGTTFTDLNAKALGLNSVDFSYGENALTPKPSGWAGGTFSFQLTSATPTAATDCYSYFGYDATYVKDCYLIHGTAHAVLVPSATLPNNAAKGTVTLDFVF
jgi:hypothetical protein